MKIDFNATKQRLLGTGRTITGWARVNKVPAGSAHVILNGRFVTNKPDEGVYASVIACLKKDGFLVMVPEKKEKRRLSNN